MFITRINVIIILTMFANCKGTILLTSDKRYAPLYGQITLTCNVDMDGVLGVNFKRGSLKLIQLGGCDAFECQTINTSKYNVSKNTRPSGYDLFYFTIKDFIETDSDEYHCEEMNNFESGSIYITFAVGIISVTLTPNTDPISVIENIQQQFTCVTSVSRPAAAVRWYLDNEEVTSGIVPVKSQDATTSTLTYTPEKLHNDRRISCRGSNGGQELSSSNRPSLNIIYGPSVPSCTYDGFVMPALITVREGWELRLNCNCDGNPTPNLSWSHPGDGVSSSLFLRNVRRIHGGIFNISARSYLVPSFQPTANLSSSVSTTVNVLYPPDPPSCHVGSATLTSSSIYAVRGMNISINCSCESNPTSSYLWSMTGVSSTTIGQYLDLHIHDKTTITLSMSNTMQLTNGSTEQGRRESPLEVYVLFPPMILPLKNVVVLEGGNVSLACQVTSGIPNKTDFIWERMSDKTIVSMEQTVGIINIDRTQSGFYRCTASNLMEPTGCDATIGNSSNTVFVDVQYSAIITEFVIAEFIGRNVVIVDENVRITLNCEVESNPASTVEILKEKLLLKRVFNAKNVDLVIESTKCQDSGTYICSGSNHHNPVSVTRTLTVLVRCSPRASPVSPPAFNVISTPDVPASLSYTFVAYPLPALSEIVWEKQDASRSGWTVIRNTNNIKVFVSVDTLQTNMSFTSVQRTDFGYYRLHVSNELGSTTEHFRLQAKDPGPSAGPIIGGAVGGSIGAVIAIIVVLVVLRRNYTLNCNIIRKTDAPAGQSDSSEDNPRRNTAQTYEDISMTTTTSVYDALKNGEHRHDISNVYMPLEDSSSKSNVNYENF